MYIIGGIHKKRKLKSPKGDQTRPTASKLRETLFNICQQEVEGAYLLDLFAGSGAIGLEALSRGAAHATFVENNRQMAALIKENIALLGEEEKTVVLCKDVFQALSQLHTPFDMIFADPPYGKNLSDQVLLFVDEHPILKVGGSLFLEDESEGTMLSLKTLKLISTRRSGRATLRHYNKFK